MHVRAQRGSVCLAEGAGDRNSSFLPDIGVQLQNVLGLALLCEASMLRPSSILAAHSMAERLIVDIVLPQTLVGLCSRDYRHITEKVVPCPSWARTQEYCKRCSGAETIRNLEPHSGTLHNSQNL